MLNGTEVLGQSDQVVHISNATNHHVIGHIEYSSQNNLDAKVTVDPETSGYRPDCLVTEISAIVKVGGNDIPAIPFTSEHGCPCRRFTVVEIEEGYAVKEQATVT